MTAQGRPWKVSALSSRSQENSSERRLRMSCVNALLLRGYQGAEFQSRNGGNGCEARSAWLEELVHLALLSFRGHGVRAFQMTTATRRALKIRKVS